MFDELKGSRGVAPEGGSRSFLWALSSQLQRTNPHSLLQGQRAEQQGLGLLGTCRRDWLGMRSEKERRHEEAT